MADSPVRSAFVVDAGGVIRFSKRYADSQVPDADELAAACRALSAV
jgi:alkyl hydroperoxide reductase subunit AhpC